MRIIKIAILAILPLISCENSLDCCLPISDESLVGKYRVYEYGYSPGDKYIVEPVSAEPAQLLNFNNDGGFSSNYQGLTSFTYYMILEDKNEGKILALFENEPDIKDEVDIDNLSHSYSIEYEEFNVKLYFRYCIEGCHIGLNKLE